MAKLCPAGYSSAAPWSASRMTTNSFDGRVRKGKNGYYSTRHNGRGIGLMSIAAVAEKYGGSARFSNSGTEFFVDVVMKV